MSITKLIQELKKKIPEFCSNSNGATFRAVTPLLLFTFLFSFKDYILLYEQDLSEFSISNKDYIRKNSLNSLPFCDKII